MINSIIILLWKLYSNFLFQRILNLKQNIMNKKLKDFLYYLETETSITYDLSTISPTQKLIDPEDKPICVNVLGINNGAFGLAVISCNCNECKDIVGAEVLYVTESEFHEAQNIQSMIQNAFPSIPVGLRNSTED